MKGSWEKIYYETSCELEFEGEAEASKDKALAMIDRWLSKKSQQAHVESNERVIEPHSFENLPWKTFQTKQLCKPGEGGWTFRDAPRAEELVDQLDKSGTSWTAINDMEYRLSGRELSLIQRRPVKK
jgi:hypothetical protein